MISLKIIGTLLLPALIASAAPPAITTGTPSDLLPTRDLALIKTVHGSPTTFPSVPLKQIYVNAQYKGYTVEDGWSAHREDNDYVAARAVTRLDGESMQDKVLEIQSLGYLLENGQDDSGRYWIVYRTYMPPHEIEDENIDYEDLQGVDIDSYFGDEK